MGPVHPPEAQRRSGPEAFAPSFREALGACELAWPIRPALAALPDGGVPTVEEIDAALSSAATVRFVRPAPKPRRQARRPDGLYDAVIARRSEVPTREGNLHDLMNALVWASFPKSKRALHERQDKLVRARIDDDGRRLVPHRSAEQDAIAMLDEGGIVVLCAGSAAPELERALARRDSAALEGAVQRGEALGVVFGHALYEHVATSRPGTIWGKTALLAVSEPRAASLATVDDLLSARLRDPGWSTDRDDSGSAPLQSSVLGKREFLT